MSQGKNRDGIDAPVGERAGETIIAYDLLHALIDSVPAHIFLKDRENRFLLVNRSLAEVTGFSQEEMVGRSAFDLFPGEDARHYFEDDLAVITSGKPRVGISEPMETVRGTRWLITHKVPHRDPQGNVVGVIGVAMDVTELRDAEEARGREEGRREAAEAALVRAQRIGVAKLAGGVAHNLNNLLTVINGYASLIEKDLSAEDPRRGMLEEMLRSGERAAELTNQLLSYSRQQTLFPRDLEMGALLRGMEPGLRKICGPRVALTVNSGSCVLRVDPNGFRQMLARLLTHACEEMERVGSVRIGAIEADLCPGDALPEVGLLAGRYLVLTLRDTGPYMDVESLSRVFEPFRRPLESGGGLELSSVYGFVKQSGGYIWVESERGVGNRFTACFPKPGTSEDLPAEKR